MRCFYVATVFTVHGCKGGLTGDLERILAMWIINREDWDLLQAAKAAQLTTEAIREMDEPAPLPMIFEGGTVCQS